MSATAPRSTERASRPKVTACNTCSATLESNQRYCVACGTRNPVAADPAASHLASATRDSRLVGSARAGAGGRRNSPWTVALLVAVPLALALGLLIGRGGNDDDLLKAIQNQPAPVVRVGSGAAIEAAASGAGAQARSRKVVRKVLAQSAAGPIEDLTSYTPSPAKKASDIKAIKRCQSKKGVSYLQCQKTLPDIVGTGPATGGGGDDGGPTGSGD